ncbi:putative Granulins domain-containing protein [Seiridium unicorne]|uniref:Granulins domain-containing protein n=1 Tax=Seiridium unicorne TaxID=138068 RepID=A0ABR2V4V4_9PEZI
MALAAIERESYAPISAALLPKRQRVTCNQAYGAGFEVCGGPNSTFCYNAGFGQTCCLDRGYCQPETYCAPVPGFCCDKNQDVATCAQNAGFALTETLMISPTVSSITSVAVDTAIAATSTVPVETAPFPTPAEQTSATANTDAQSLPAGSSNPIIQNATAEIVSTNSAPAQPQPTLDSIGTPTTTRVAVVATVPFAQVAIATRRSLAGLRPMAATAMTVIIVLLW